MEARYVQRSESIDIIPEKEILSGEIIILNSLVGVAKLPIKKGELGTLALSGIYEITKTNSCAFSIGAAVYWDNENRSATTSGDIFLGLATKKSTLEDSKVQVVLNSGGTPTNSGEITLHWQTIN